MSQGQVWAKELEDGSRAVGLFNTGDQPVSVSADFAKLKLAGKQVVRDLWRQKDVATVEGTYEVNVAPHGVVLIKLTPAK
jgi:alpha-galactosidase